MERRSRCVTAIWVLLSLFLLTLGDWQFGGVRFVGTSPNVIIALITVWLPAICAVLLGFRPRSRARAWAFACLIPVALLCSVFGSVVALGQALPVWKRQASITVGNSQVVTYFTDAGAWDNGEVIVQQEFKLMPGLLWVKPLSSQECLRDVSILVLDRHHVRCYYPPDTADTTDPHPEAQRDDVWVF